MDSLSWKDDVRLWLQRGRIKPVLHDEAIAFFERSFANTRCYDRAWFGIHKDTVSLVVGGIFLAALLCSGYDKGVWLLIDQNLPEMSSIRFLPVKSTQRSVEPLLWAHSPTFDALHEIIKTEIIWDSYANASEKVIRSSRCSGDRDEVQLRRKKQRLSDIYPIRHPVSCIFSDEVIPSITLREGSVSQVLVNAYERNPIAREQCIAYYRAVCVVCGFNFSDVYGDVANGYIHVHHLRALASIGDEYQVDPIRDLRPVCPNYHAVIHLRDPAYTIEEVKEMLR